MACYQILPLVLAVCFGIQGAASASVAQCVYPDNKKVDLTNVPEVTFESGQLTYYLHPCKSLAKPSFCTSNKDVEGSSTSELGATCNAYQKDGRGFCHCLSDPSLATWTVLSVDNKIVGISLNHTGGDEKRSTEFVMACAKKSTPPTTETESPQLSYHFLYPNPFACHVIPGYGSGGGGIGGVAIFDIIIVCSLAAFIIFGSLYNWKAKGLSGVEVIPLKDFWKEIPSLCKDGCLFTYGKIKTVFYRLTGKSEAI